MNKKIIIYLGIAAALATCAIGYAVYMTRKVKIMFSVTPNRVPLCTKFILYAKVTNGFGRPLRGVTVEWQGYDPKSRMWKTIASFITDEYGEIHHEVFYGTDVHWKWKRYELPVQFRMYVPHAKVASTPQTVIFVTEPCRGPCPSEERTLNEIIENTLKMVKLTTS